MEQAVRRLTRVRQGRPGDQNRLSPESFVTRILCHQDGWVSPPKRKVHAPVNTCVTSDSLHRCHRFFGPPDSAFQIVAIASAVTNAIRIHPLRLILLCPALPLRDVVDHIVLLDRILGKDAPGNCGAGAARRVWITADKRMP